MALVATVHGRGLPSIISDPERRELIGGLTSNVLLSDAAAWLRPDRKKSVEKRRSAPVFDVAIEVRGFHDWVVHPDVGAAVDAHCDGRPSPCWRHRKDVEANQVVVEPLVAMVGDDAEFEYYHLEVGAALPPPGERVPVDFSSVS